MQEEMVIQSRTFDLLAWLLPMTNKFPRPFRFTVTQRMSLVALEFQEALVLAQSSNGRERNKQLVVCDAKLTQLRLYLRLAHHWHWLNDGQYEHVSKMITEIGRLLGGWLKQAKTGKRGTPALR